MCALRLCWLGKILAALAAAASPPSGTFISIKAYPLPTVDSQPADIALGSDGALWFTEFRAGKIGRITTSGAITEFPVSAGCGPGGITLGPDGAIWFVCLGGGIGRISTTAAITYYASPMGPGDITTGPDGALWFTQEFGNEIGRLTIYGALTEYSPPTASSQPGGITAGPDGSLWFTEYMGDKIGQLTTSGAFSEYPLPSPDSGPGSIAVGPDRALWFTEFYGRRVGRITTAGAITEYSIPSSDGGPEVIVSGPDGALWFTVLGTGMVARITTAGAITGYSLPSTLSGPSGIAVGADGDLWFIGGNQIARLPACAIGLSASFANHTLTMNFNLGINRPAIWSVSAGKGFGLRRPIRAVTPPRAFRLHWRPYPSGGHVRVKSSLSDEAGNVLCSEWTTVNTAP
jgi:streptogramin lyase